jgi:hypothetical protein
MAMAQLAGLSPQQRANTIVTMTKSGNDIVLSWTTTPAGSYNYYIYRGIMHAEYRAEVLIATITNDATTYTDTGALTRQRQGYAINEFYKVYAVPKIAKPLAATTMGENTRLPRNQSVDVAVVVPEGNTNINFPSVNFLGQDIRLSQSTMQKADLDLANLPIPDTPVVVRTNALEYGARTVVHIGYHSGAYIANQSSDVVLTTHIRQVPKPQVSRNGNAVSIAWDAIQTDYTDTIREIKVIRSYKGVGDNEPSVVVSTLPANPTSANDDITDVTTDWYCFWQLRVIYNDGTASDCGPSSDWIRR